MAPVRCTWSRLAALHGASRTVVVTEQVTALTAYVSCAGCEIPGRSGFCPPQL